MVLFPHSKINLGLRILSMRGDGYHNIETCFYPISWCDVLEIVPSKTFSFTCRGVTIPNENEDNSCIKAYKLMQPHFKLPPVAIYLHKIVPVGAGLGGGSSNATHTIKILNQLFKLNLSQHDMLSYATQLDSDCAYFVYDTPMLGTGRGDVLKTLNMSLHGKFLVLVNPHIHISSTEMYAKVTPHEVSSSLQNIVENNDSITWKNTLINDFERIIFKKYPIIEAIKEKFYTQGALYASMSGSGSTVFGIFDFSVSLQHLFPKMLYWSTQL